MHDLNFALKQLCKRNRDGSFSTQALRARELDLCARQIRELGYTRFKDPHKLKGRHVTALVGGKGRAAVGDPAAQFVGLRHPGAGARQHVGGDGKSTKIGILRRPLK